MTAFPSLFVSHGAPTFAIEDGAAHRYLTGLGPRLDAAIARPRAIIVASAHHRAPVASVTGAKAPRTIHDFRGFDAKLYEIRYPAPGAPELARSLCSLLEQQGIAARVDEARGLDHGTWVPLRLLYPKADVPVVQLSISMEQTPQYHFALGRTVSALRREGYLFIGSGGATHNLRAFFSNGYHHDHPALDWVRAFADWLAERVEDHDVGSILEAVERGPEGIRNHPTMDHILPLFFALGAGQAPAGDAPSSARVLHRSTTYAVLSMDVFGFGDACILDALR